MSPATRRAIRSQRIREMERSLRHDARGHVATTTTVTAPGANADEVEAHQRLEAALRGYNWACASTAA